MKGKAWHIILFFLLALTACAGEEPEDISDRESVQSQPSARPTKEPEGNPIWGYLQNQPSGVPAKELEKLEEDGELVWWDGYFEYFYQDIRPAVGAAKQMPED